MCTSPAFLFIVASPGACLLRNFAKYDCIPACSLPHAYVHVMHTPMRIIIKLLRKVVVREGITPHANSRECVASTSQTFLCKIPYLVMRLLATIKQINEEAFHVSVSDESKILLCPMK